MDVPIRVLELRSVWGTGGGPEKTILMGAALSDPSRIAVTVCYIRDARDTVFGIGDRAGQLPIDYVEVRERHSFDPGVFRQLRQLVRERAIDIVHAHDYKTDLLAWLLSWYEPVAPLATVHGWTGNSARERLVYYPADKRVLARFPDLVAVSSDIRDELIRHGARRERIVTILNGIDPRQFKRQDGAMHDIRREFGIPPDAFVIGSVGRLEKQKRFDLLLNAVAALRADHPNVHLIVAGDGSLRSALQAQVEALGLNDCCHLLGHRTDIAALHHAMDLFVQSSDYEGTPNAVLEAMALETPVIATNAGGTAELVRHGIDGVILPVGDLQRLTAAIVAALCQPDAPRAHATSARGRVEETLSFGARQARLEDIYRQISDRRAAARARTAVTA
jgi:glycosyltransferase involved in cell wall biosynthesis